MNDTQALATPAEIARAAGAEDLFVFRRIANGRFAHVGGVGRGSGWAGIVEIDEGELAPAQPVVRERTGEPHRVFGPYWARSAVTVRVSDDIVVVFGGQSDTGADLSDDEYKAIAVAAYAADGLIEVAAAKRLADELELLTAVQGLLRQPPEGTVELLDHIVEHATRALSCELGLVYLSGEQRFAVCDLRGEGALMDDDVLSAADELARRERFPACVQDAVADPLPRPFAVADGIRSYYLLELQEPAKGVLLLMHTDAAPARGFTSLCQLLGQQVVEAAQPLLAASLMRDRMRERLAHAEHEARRDALTGLANRLGWDEARAAFSGATSVGVVVVDAARLKVVNDTLGHQCGDEVLRTIAGVLRDAVRESDVVARLGGDEFGILLRETDGPKAAAVVERIKERIARSRLPNGTTIEVACGWAIAGDGNLAHAQEQADAAMLAEKRERRAA